MDKNSRPAGGGQGLKNIFNKLAGRRPRIQNEYEYQVFAVLLPLIQKQDQLYILFEVRAGNLRRQPGEICFPGGRVELWEMARPHTAAVRETVEELGIRQEQVVLIGPLDYLVNPHGTLIYPYLGVIEDYQDVTPNPAEVEEIFLAPLEYFMLNPPSKSSLEVVTRYAPDFPFHKVPESYQKEGARQGSFTVYFYEYGRFIWGMTARILYNLVNICCPEVPARQP
jgi:coenzyme A diphosphatase NUDT7